MRILLAAVLAMAIGSAHATVVRVGDREWLSLGSDLFSVSYNDLAEVFDPLTGKLRGSDTTLNAEGVEVADVSGWKWASTSDVLRLFETIPGHSLMPETGFDWNDYFSYGQQNTALGDFFEGNFRSSYLSWEGVTFQYVSWDGWTRDTYLGLGHTISLVRGYVSTHEEEFLFHHDVLRSDYYETSSFGLGAWLYRDVPEPPAIALLGLGLILMARRWRRTGLGPDRPQALGKSGFTCWGRARFGVTPPPASPGF